MKHQNVRQWRSLEAQSTFVNLLTGKKQFTVLGSKQEAQEYLKAADADNLNPEKLGVTVSRTERSTTFCKNDASVNKRKAEVSDTSFESLFGAKPPKKSE
jgi:hypothetical protein